MSKDTHAPEEKFWEAIRDIRVAMLTTLADNRMESRPMNAFVDEGAREILFLTRLNTAATTEIGSGSPVSLGFADTSDQTYIAVSGTAVSEHNPAKQKELWNSHAQAWLPEGPEAPSTGLIRVRPDHAAVWDSPSSKLVRRFEVAKANITGNPPSSGTVEHIKL